MQTFKRTTILGAAAVAAALAPATAGADTRVVVEKNHKLERSATALTECDGFTFSERYSVRRTIVEVYADDGTLLRERISVKYKGTATHDQTGGTLPVDGTRTIVADHEAGTWTESGVLRHVTARGEGIVLQDAGRVVEDLESEELLEMAGRHELRTGEMDAFCAALAAA